MASHRWSRPLSLPTEEEEGESSSSVVSVAESRRYRGLGFLASSFHRHLLLQGQGQLVVLSVPEMEPVFSTEVAVNSLLTVAHSGLGSVQGAVCVLQPSQCEDGTTK